MHSFGLWDALALCEAGKVCARQILLWQCACLICICRSGRPTWERSPVLIMMSASSRRPLTGVVI
jgi:hypothetical protein